MAWPSIRAFLGIPDHLTGRGVSIAVLDGTFAGHPDISDGTARRSRVVLTGQAGARPEPARPTLGPWPAGAHGLWAAAAAGGSGAACRGAYQGAAPEADLLLLAGYVEGLDLTDHQRQLDALRWLRDHWKQHQVRGVQTAIRGLTGSGLLPWQTEPLRIACEQLWDEGLLVVASSGNSPDCVARVAQAAAPSVLAVGGVVVQPPGGWRDAVAYHGCRGTTFEQRWTPDVLAPAKNLVLPFLDDDNDDDAPSGYLRMDGGTSCAGPIALGAAACVWQAHPDWSALQVRTALVRTARWQPGWSSLRAGLIDVETAARWRTDPTPVGTPTPYRRYVAWRDRSSATRIASARADDGAEAVEALLSFLPDQVNDEVAGASVGLLQRSSPRMKAAALCVLAAQPDHVSAELLRPHLADANVHVRGAALTAVRAAPHVWEPLLPNVGGRLADTSPEVCQAAAELAEDMRAVQLVEALVDGLTEDIRRRWPTCFNARTRALERLTGAAFRPRSEWRVGQPVFDDRWWLAREGVAANWRAWLAG
jgi:serine protease AprX